MENIFDGIKKLIEIIDFKKINFDIIKINVSKLMTVYKKLNKIWKDIDFNKVIYTIYSKNTMEFKNKIKLLNSNFLSNNKNIKKIIDNAEHIHLLNFQNIYFYWLSNIGEKNFTNNDYLLSSDMFKIAFCLNKFTLPNDKIKRIIIWIPIDKKRNFNYETISKINLNKSEEKFEAFVASGVTFGFGIDQKITIITRYEEIVKLLIHELIHNYNIDGSKYHTQLEKILIEYQNVKPENNYHYEYSIYESYTELLSTYFYLLFDNIIKNNNLNHDKLLGQIVLEIIYSYNTVCNIIRLIPINNFDEFIKKKEFMGKICIYEYYYLKALMYNNYVLNFGSTIGDFTSIYQHIIKITNTNDFLMEDIFNADLKQINFKYQFH